MVNTNNTAVQKKMLRKNDSTLERAIMLRKSAEIRPRKRGEIGVNKCFKGALKYQQGQKLKRPATAKPLKLNKIHVSQ